eukprot:gene12181-5671_t
MNETQEKRQQELMIMQQIHEKCLSKYQTKEETVSTLYHHPADLVRSVWDKLEKQNPEYFKMYNLRLLIKNQVSFYNDVAYLMKEPTVKKYMSKVSYSGNFKCSPQEQSPSEFKVTN